MVYFFTKCIVEKYLDMKKIKKYNINYIRYNWFFNKRIDI